MLRSLTLALLTLPLLAGCPAATDDPAPVTDADAEAYVPEVAGDMHAHTALYGGELIEVGDHEYSMETKEEDGKLYVYVMDAHHENPVSVAPADIELELDLEDGDEVELDAEAIEADDAGNAHQYVFTMPEGTTTLAESDGHFHLTVAGKEYHVDLHPHGDDHDHDDHDDHDHDDEKKNMENDEPAVEEVPAE